MIVGTLEMHLRLPGCESLKEKRHILRGMLERTRTHFQVSCAEVGDNDLRGNACVGVSVVRSAPVHAESVLQHVLASFDSRPDLEVDWSNKEIVRTGTS
jgi:hypothetical protein